MLHEFSIRDALDLSFPFKPGDLVVCDTESYLILKIDSSCGVDLVVMNPYVQFEIVQGLDPQILETLYAQWSLDILRSGEWVKKRKSP